MLCYGQERLLVRDVWFCSSGRSSTGLSQTSVISRLRTATWLCSSVDRRTWQGQFWARPTGGSRCLKQTWGSLLDGWTNVEAAVSRWRRRMGWWEISAERTIKDSFRHLSQIANDVMIKLQFNIYIYFNVTLPWFCCILYQSMIFQVNNKTGNLSLTYLKKY